MTHASRIHETGGPEVLCWEEVHVGVPAAGELLIRHTAVGLNLIDTYHRSGLHPPPSMPAVLGMEAAGVVEAVGKGASGFRPGTRVAYATSPPGAYAERRVRSQWPKAACSRSKTAAMPHACILP